MESERVYTDVVQVPVIVVGTPSFEGWMLTQGAPYLTLVVGALLSKRWLDLPFVALVTMLMILVSSEIYEYLTYGSSDTLATISAMSNIYNLSAIVTVYATLLVVAGVVHGSKRMLERQLFRSRNQDSTTATSRDALP
jgi:hypothetical protein